MLSSAFRSLERKWHSRTQSCDPLGQRHGSRALAGDRAFSSPEAAIHLASAMDRDLWPAPIFSPRFTDFRSFCAVSYFYQNGGPGNKFWTRNSKFQRHHMKQYEVLKLLVVEEKDVLAVLPTGYGKSLTY